MYANVLSFKNAHTLAIQTEVPYSVDKVVDGWNLIKDEAKGEIISFRGSEIVTIASMPVEKGAKVYPRHNTAKRPGGKKPAIKTAIKTE